MGWLVQQVVASALGAFFIVTALEYILKGVKASVPEIVKPSIFVGVWTAITTALGIHGFTKGVRKTRQLLGGDKEVDGRKVSSPTDKRVR
jgi:hypothetical protein